MDTGGDDVDIFLMPAQRRNLVVLGLGQVGGAYVVSGPRVLRWCLFVCHVVLPLSQYLGDCQQLPRIRRLW